MSKHLQSNPPENNLPQPGREDEDFEPGDIEQPNDDAPIDDPGDAQRTSKSEPDGDGEETDA